MRVDWVNRTADDTLMSHISQTAKTAVFQAADSPEMARRISRRAPVAAAGDARGNVAKDRGVRALAAAAGLCAVSAQAQPVPHACAAEALTQARALLVFHSGDASRVDIDDRIRVLAPIRNPANARQRFDVLEVIGHVYRADYRIRLLYARLPGACTLMGQEVIELSSL